MRVRQPRLATALRTGEAQEFAEALASVTRYAGHNSIGLITRLRLRLQGTAWGTKLSELQRTEKPGTPQGRVAPLERTT